jgi:hypothetical protein
MVDDSVPRAGAGMAEAGPPMAGPASPRTAQFRFELRL